VGTYSFISVQASITGPGGAFQLGYGAGVAEEGISWEMLDDKDMLAIGADGQLMHSLRASDAARLTIRLLKTSPTNAKLNTMYNFQKSSPGAWGQNILVVSDTLRGDVLTGSEIAFARQPMIQYAKDANMNEWSFLGNVQEILGTGVPAIGV
jgi:hypothetical protein